MKDLGKKAKAYALKNALQHKGKANHGAVISALFNEGLAKDEVKTYAPKISEILKEVNSLSSEKQKKEFEKLKDLISERPHQEGLPELPEEIQKNLVTRFSPSPSGALHIGHARTAAFSLIYVKKYGGKFYTRIEDTNPEQINPDAYTMIKDEMNWLSENSTEFVIQSERMDLYYGYAVALIEKKKAYVCTCSGDEFRELAKNKKDCPCRNKDEKQNIKDWKKMLDKKGFNEGEAVLRFKSDMKHPNPAMRDFPLARICLAEHPLQKKKYRVWPLMNLAVTADDIDLGLTYIVRGKDHMDNAKRQKMIYDVLEEKFPKVEFIGRYKFKGIELSKRKIAEGIKEGKYSGWDDPRLATIASLRKRYKPETILKFTEHTGLSEVDKILDSKEFFRLLDSFEKE